MHLGCSRFPPKCSAIRANIDIATWAEVAQAQYRISPDVVHGNANNTALKLDVWQNQKAVRPAPTVVYFHSGGWVTNNKIEPTLTLLPYVEMGWNIVHVEYRLANVAFAPAAVEGHSLRVALDRPQCQAIQQRDQPNRALETLCWWPSIADYRNPSVWHDS